MPRYEFDLNLPKDEDEFLERLVDAHTEGVKVGRQEGAKEIIDRVDDWVQKQYYNKDVVRKSPLAEGILDIAAKLVHGLLHGDLGQIPVLRSERKRPNNRPTSEEL